MLVVLHNKKFLLIFALFFIICLLIFKAKYAYYRDIELVYSVAQKVGYKKENSLGIYHSTDTLNYDNIELVFLSPLTTAKFAHDVEKSGFYTVGKYGPSPSYTIWDEIFYITHKPTPRNGTIPAVTAWDLSINDRFISVRYIDIRGTTWIHEGRLLHDNIVIIMLNRRAY